MNSKSVVIVADGSVLEALKSSLNGLELVADHIETGAALVVYAETLTNETFHRSEDGGLKRLQRLLAHPTTEPVEIAVLSFRPVVSHRSYNYLLSASSPIRYVQIPSKDISPQNSVPSVQEWRDLVRTASEMELEIACASYRHSLRSLMAAVRIYLGGAIANQVSVQKVQITLPKFDRLAKREDPHINLDSKLLLEGLVAHQRFSADYKSTIKPTKTKLWVLDDCWEDHGWKYALNDLMPGMVTGFKSWNALEERIRKGIDRPDALMIDCNLGKGFQIPTGLELLHSIRSVWQDVRIIFATGYDDAALALTSLREGANVFFAKALNDPLDRRSLDYYSHFSQLLQVKKRDRKVSTSWRAFQLKTKPGILLKVKPGVPLPVPALEEIIRVGFYILFSFTDQNLWWVGTRTSVSEKALFRAVANTLLLGIDLKGLAKKEDTSLATLIRACTHGGEPIAFEDLMRILDFLLAKLEDQSSWTELPIKPWGRAKPNYWPYEIGALQTDSTHPGLPKGKKMPTHELAESKGAIELVQGINCLQKCKHKAGSVDDVLIAHKLKKSKKFYSDVVFVDDRGDANGWFKAVSSFLPGCRTYESTTKLFHDLKTRPPISLVLLDLKLPTYEAGLRALTRLISELPAVPVITLSAGHDSLAAIRSLRRGALDFFSKTLPFPRSPVGRFEFADEFRTKCHLMLEFGRSKCPVQERLLQGLRNGLRWHSKDDLLEVRNKIKSCHRYRKKLPRYEKVDIPPDPATWAGQLSEEFDLILHLRRQAFWLEEQKTGYPDRLRLNLQRTYQVRPLDFWRWEQVLASNDISAFVRLGAILGGVIVDRIARWNWCLTYGRPLRHTLWGTKFPGSLVIGDEVKTIGGEAIWDRRNEAIYSLRKKWSQSHFDNIIDHTFAAFREFLNLHGASF